MLGIFLDSETSGLSSEKHALLEIAYKIVDLKNGRVCESYEAIVYHPITVWQESDPDSLKVNGFTYEIIKDGKKIDVVQQEILESFKRMKISRESAVFICQNPSFDRAFFSHLFPTELQETLNWPYHWLDLASMFWGICLRDKKYPWKSGLSKDNIAQYLSLEKEASPHRAMNGVSHLLACYRKLVGFPG